jgi:virulence factor
MLKVGIIGLGDIARKAYLPVLSSMDLELHLYTRDQEKLNRIGRQYRFKNMHGNMQSILNSGIEAAFVHTATGSHEEIIEQLLLHNIHVYVDKPITYDYESSKRLVALAESRNLILMVGFNRRYAPSYRELKQLVDPNMVILQKNRKFLPAEVRPFIFDDFIHVIDTLRYIFSYPVKEIIVKGLKKDNMLLHVVVQMEAQNGAIAIGIMNRDSGTLEEKLEVFSTAEKRTVYNLTDMRINRDKNEIISKIDDWDSTLYKRGFEQIVTDFLLAVKTDRKTQFTTQDALITHQICEDIVAELNKI